MREMCDDSDHFDTKKTTVGSRPSSWPDGAPFALFLSHDIDKIYDREIFRIMSDLNHLRRVLFRGEPGSAGMCAKRIIRALLRPREPGHDIERILKIEERLGFKSTFFLLEDRSFSRIGGRYCYVDAATKRIAIKIVDSGCEIALHGAYHNFNNVESYKAQARSFRKAFGLNPIGIRNHYLRHDGVETWKAQCKAGFLYDATFGFRCQVGIREGRAFPFFPFKPKVPEAQDFIVFPMTIMDCALFSVMNLSGKEALALCKSIGSEVMAAGGQLCLNWHNNYFNEEEFFEWEKVYEEYLGWLSTLRPWNATGKEIAEYWKKPNQLSRPNITE